MENLVNQTIIHLAKKKNNFSLVPLRILKSVQVPVQVHASNGFQRPKLSCNFGNGPKKLPPIFRKIKLNKRGVSLIFFNFFCGVYTAYGQSNIFLISYCDMLPFLFSGSNITTSGKVPIKS